MAANAEASACKACGSTLNPSGHFPRPARKCGRILLSKCCRCAAVPPKQSLVRGFREQASECGAEDHPDRPARLRVWTAVVRESNESGSITNRAETKSCKAREALLRVTTVVLSRPAASGRWSPKSLQVGTTRRRNRHSRSGFLGDDRTCRDLPVFQLAATPRKERRSVHGRHSSAGHAKLVTTAVHL